MTFIFHNFIIDKNFQMQPGMLLLQLPFARHRLTQHAHLRVLRDHLTVSDERSKINLPSSSINTTTQLPAFGSMFMHRAERIIEKIQDFFEKDQRPLSATPSSAWRCLPRYTGGWPCFSGTYWFKFTKITSIGSRDLPQDVRPWLTGWNLPLFKLIIFYKIN